MLYDLVAVREPIVVTHQESTMEQAIDGAIHNLKKSDESALAKESTRDHHAARRGRRTQELTT
jgi:hypothetical protein